MTGVRDRKTWWNNRIGLTPASGLVPGMENTARLVVGRKNTDIQSGWELLADRSENITRESARELIKRLVERIRDVNRIDVAVAGPIPLAWAVGHALRNTGKPIRFFVKVENSYILFWERNGCY